MRGNFEILVIESSGVAHEPKDENPIHHQEPKTAQAAAGQASWVFGLIVIKCQQVRDHSRQIIILAEVVVYVSVILSDPFVSLLLIVFVAFFSAKCNSKGVVDSSHPVLFESAQNGRGVHTVRVGDAFTVGVSCDLNLVRFRACACSSLSITFSHRSISCFPVITSNVPECVWFGLLECGSQVVWVNVKIELSQEFACVSAANHCKSD